MIAELFNTLYFNYGINRIYGIRSGFRGFWDPKFFPYIELTPEGIRGIDAIGGTVLGSSRGGFNLDAIMQACMNRGINQLYIIGGDGTHRAADLIQHEARKRKIKMTVACVPKTIDNDIGGKFTLRHCSSAAHVHADRVLKRRALPAKYSQSLTRQSFVRCCADALRMQ